ncbi:MAG: TonB-dependent receptor, partial [Pseudomonadota bacterium]
MSIKNLLRFSCGVIALAAPAHAFAQEVDVVRETKHVDLDEIIVTSTPLERTLGQSITGGSVLTGEELAEQIESSIGETLRREPGLTSTFFGAGASRPIIRGLGGDRIRVLEDGIGTFDAAQTSPDHAVPIEPALAQRIKVFRGPASLLYGSSAAGGVVNTKTGKIAEEIPEDGLDGALRYSYSTVNNGNEVAGGFNAAAGDIVVHLEGFYRDADDYDIPGLNGSDALIDALTAAAAEDGETFDADEEFTDGVVPNSDLSSNGGSGGLSYVFDENGYDGFFGFSVSVLNTNYGVPAGILTEEDLEGEEEGEEGEEEGEEEGIRIDLEQIRYDLAGEVNGDLGWFETLKVRIGYGDYRHVELEGDEVGTLFENEEIETRLELVGKSYDFLGGEVSSAIGFQGRFRDLSAVGAEAFVPPSEQTQLGFFALKEYRNGNLILDGAARYEHVSNTTDAFVAEEEGTPAPAENTFDLFSVSAGAGVQLTPSVFVGVNGFRTQRAPSLEESFSFGPHLATQSFEVGDPTLEIETARGVEATIRGEFGPITAIVNGFYTNYNNFVFEQETGEILDGLPVFAFTQADTVFRGFEAEVDADLGTINSGFGPISFAGHAQVDLVRATSEDLVDEDQPRIPPLSTLFGLSAANQWASLRGEV